MGLFNWLFGKREVHIHLHGTVNLNCENLKLSPSIQTVPNEEVKPGKKDGIDFELEPEMNDIQIPEVDFGEDVDT